RIVVHHEQAVVVHRSLHQSTARVACDGAWFELQRLVKEGIWPAGSARLTKYPWQRSQPSSASRSSAPALSTPSAHTSRPRLCPSSMSEPIIVRACALLGRCVTRLLSIFISSNGMRWSRVTDE